MEVIQLASRKQRRIIREIMAGMQGRIQELLPSIPQDWDGIELRWWVTELCAENFVKADTKRTMKRRYKRYTHDKIVKNL